MRIYREIITFILFKRRFIRSERKFSIAILENWKGSWSIENLIRIKKKSIDLVAEHASVIKPKAVKSIIQIERVTRIKEMRNSLCESMIYSSRLSTYLQLRAPFNPH